MISEFESFLSAFSDDVQVLTRQVRELVFEVLPDVSEHTYPAMKIVRYGLDGSRMSGVVCYIAPLKSGVNLGFHRGTSLPDPAKLLEGTGKNLRHLRLHSSVQLHTEAVRALLEAAKSIA